jgi:hypothetical protein
MCSRLRSLGTMQGRRPFHQQTAAQPLWASECRRRHSHGSRGVLLPSGRLVFRAACWSASFPPAECRALTCGRPPCPVASKHYPLMDWGCLLCDANRDAWILGKTVSQQPVTSTELVDMSEQFKPWVEQLEALPPENRREALADLLKGRPDAPAIIWAIAQSDPSGPPPERAVRPSADELMNSTPSRNASPSWNSTVVLVEKPPVARHVRSAVECRHSASVCYPWRRNRHAR